jgi:hypothetical protein
MRLFAYIFIFIALVSCSKKSVNSPAEYLAFCSHPDNGLVVDKEFNNILYKAKLQTPEAILFGAEQDFKSSSEYHQKLVGLKDKLNFVFLIEDVKGSSRQVRSAVFNKSSYGSMLAYANTDLAKDFTLLQGTDTIYCSVVHLEAANSVQPIIRIALGFDGIDTTKAKDFTLIYNDNFFQNGPLKFHYAPSVFNNLPEIKI